MQPADLILLHMFINPMRDYRIAHLHVRVGLDLSIKRTAFPTIPKRAVGSYSEAPHRCNPFTAPHDDLLCGPSTRILPAAGSAAIGPEIDSQGFATHLRMAEKSASLYPRQIPAQLCTAIGASYGSDSQSVQGQALH